jgi:hypothetical protein
MSGTLFGRRADTPLPGAAASRGRLHCVVLRNAGDGGRSYVDAIGEPVRIADCHAFGDALAVAIGQSVDVPVGCSLGRDDRSQRFSIRHDAGGERFTKRRDGRGEPEPDPRSRDRARRS